MKIVNFLFPSGKESVKSATVLLLARVVFGLLLASHGLQKLQGFSAMAGQFPDPLGVGSEVSLILAIFGELVCSVALIFGFLSRLVLIPMIVTMFVAFAITHQFSIAEGELAFAYLMVFVLLFIAGPGTFSIDRLIRCRFFPER